MEILVFFAIIIAVVVKNLKKENAKNQSGNNASGTSSRQQAPYRPQQQTGRYSTSSNAGSFTRPYTKTGSANIARDGRVYASIDFDNTHYHAEGFDFDCCISFKGLPPGTDELAVLIASNNRHERELAMLLQERQS